MSSAAAARVGSLPIALVALVAFALVGVTPRGAAAETRLKDIVALQGVSSTPLMGYGLVIGLSKTGDRRQTIFSAQTLANMLQRFGVSVPADQIKIENVAAVLVTAMLFLMINLATDLFYSWLDPRIRY